MASHDHSMSIPLPSRYGTFWIGERIFSSKKRAMLENLGYHGSWLRCYAKPLLCKETWSSMSSFSADNPSPRWRELVALYRRMHTEGDGALAAEEMFVGMPRLEQISNLKALVDAHEAKSLLDYGSGKGMQWRMDFNLGDFFETDEKRLRDFLGLETVNCFDPGYEPFSKPPPTTYDGVICLDVLEHCPEDDVPWVLDQIFGYASRFVLANIASYPVTKVLSNGETAHCTVKQAAWWREHVAVASAAHPAVRYRIHCREPSPDGSEILEIVLEG